MQGVNSPRVKLLYDIYHMQIMEGDVIRTIRDHLAHIAHFHTGGVPGRNEIDDGQELNYRSVCTAIADAGFTGYLAHEFVPKRDPLTSLAEAFRLCDVVARVENQSFAASCTTRGSSAVVIVPKLAGPSCAAGAPKFVVFSRN